MHKLSLILYFLAVTVCNNNMVKALPVVPEFDIPGAFAEQFDEVADYRKFQLCF